tara:strand:- start:403 stop:816 length:414 start_codon:yes stop_codon:yes gene_type:complete
MIIVSNITGGNTISFIPRGGIDSFIERVLADGGIVEISECSRAFTVKVVLTDQVTGDIITEYPTFSTVGYLTQCTLDTDLNNQRRYSMVVVGTYEKELYRDLIFCSTQNLADYSISNGEINTDSAPTETAPQYIIID